MSRIRKIIQKEILPDSKRVAPRILPVEVAVYSSPEIEKLRDLARDEFEFTEGSSLSEKNLDEVLLADIAEPIAMHFETMFIRKFYRLARDLLVYDIQNMQPKKRREFLENLHRLRLPSGRDTSALMQKEKQLDSIEEGYLKENLSEKPPFTFEKLIDFEGAVMVHISREELTKKYETIRNRLTASLLETALDGRFAIPPYLFKTMKQLEMVTGEEYEKRLHIRHKKSHERFLRELLKKYNTLSFGERVNRIFKGAH